MLLQLKKLRIKKKLISLMMVTAMVGITLLPGAAFAGGRIPLEKDVYVVDPSETDQLDGDDAAEEAVMKSAAAEVELPAAYRSDS